MVAPAVLGAARPGVSRERGGSGGGKPWTGTPAVVCRVPGQPRRAARRSAPSVRTALTCPGTGTAAAPVPAALSSARSGGNPRPRSSAGPAPDPEPHKLLAAGPFPTPAAFGAPSVTLSWALPSGHRGVTALCPARTRHPASLLLPCEGQTLTGSFGDGRSCPELIKKKLFYFKRPGGG